MDGSIVAARAVEKTACPRCRLHRGDTSLSVLNVTEIVCDSRDCLVWGGPIILANLTMFG